MAPPREPDERAARAAERLQSFVSALPLAGGSDGSRILEPVAAELFGAFANRGIDALLLKGPALAHLLYEPGEHRAYVDLDLLVAPAHLEQAGALLEGLGYRNTAERLGIEDVGGVVHADTWLSPIDAAESHELDVHRWLPGAETAPEAAWEALRRHRSAITLAGVQIPVLAREGQALQLATHAAQHGPTYIKGLGELSLALERWPLDVWRQAASLAAEVGAADAFAAGLRLVPQGAWTTAELQLADPTALDWEIRHLGERPRGAFHVDAFRDAATLRDRLGLARKALLPNPRWLAVEYHWAKRGPVRLALAYGLHLVRTPVWATRAWIFRRRARRNG
jgi:hypothetical protein